MHTERFPSFPCYSENTLSRVLYTQVAISAYCIIIIAHGLSTKVTCHIVHWLTACYVRRAWHHSRDNGYPPTPRTANASLDPPSLGRFGWTATHLWIFLFDDVMCSHLSVCVTSHLHKHSEFLYWGSFSLRHLSQLIKLVRSPAETVFGCAWTPLNPTASKAQEKTGREARAPAWLSEDPDAMSLQCNSWHSSEPRVFCLSVLARSALRFSLCV